MAKTKYSRLFSKKHPDKNRTIEMIAEDKAYVIVVRKKFVKLLHIYHQANYDFKKHQGLFYLQQGSAFRECTKWNNYFDTDAFQVLEITLEAEGQVKSKKIDFELAGRKPRFKRVN